MQYSRFESNSLCKFGDKYPVTMLRSWGKRPKKKTSASQTNWAVVWHFLHSRAWCQRAYRPLQAYDAAAKTQTLNGWNLTQTLKVPFFYHFIRKRNPFHIPSIEKWHSFDIPSWELCMPLTSVNAPSLRYELIKKPERFFNFFTARKCIISPLGPIYRMKWQSSVPFHMLQIIKSLPFHIPEALKRHPF